MSFLKLRSASYLAGLFGLIACQHVAPVHIGESPMIEYIAHASFKITGTDGTSIVTDPFNSRTWLGYVYPKDLTANAVFISHAHFDHDASYNLNEDAQIHRAPKRVQVGSILAQGFSTEHMGSEGLKESGRDTSNTAWVFSVGKKRILHLGDSRPLTHEEIDEIGSVDIIIANTEEIKPMQELKAALNAKTVLLMHFSIPGLSKTDNGLNTADQWAKNLIPLNKISSNGALIEFLPSGFITLKPHPNVRKWSSSFTDAKSYLNDAVQAIRQSPPNPKEAKRLLHNAITSDPGNISPYIFLAQILEREGQLDEAIETLESGLKQATDLDWNIAYQTHSKLLNFYKTANDKVHASMHQDWIDNMPEVYQNRKPH